jgi:uncharacterized protein (DUF952 family)
MSPALGLRAPLSPFRVTQLSGLGLTPGSVRLTHLIGSVERPPRAKRGLMLIYKLLDVQEWRMAKAAGQYRGSVVDLSDGYLHFSTADQVVETAAIHFAGRHDLVMLTVDARRLGDALRWEPSRGGGLFPHLYAPLLVSTVVAEVELPSDVAVATAVADALDQAP